MMSNERKDFEVSVAPEMVFYRFLQSSPYSIEGALSEFIDNSIQSYLDNRSRFAEGRQLDIEITVDSATNNIIVRDNAGGIPRGKFQQAFNLGQGQDTHDSSSLSVYGVGMKTAAVWMSQKWQVETTALDSEEVLTTTFDLNDLLNNKRSKINITSQPAPKEEHYTKIILSNSLRAHTKEYYSDHVLPFLLETFFKFEFLRLTFIHDQVVLQPNSKKLFLKPGDPLFFPEVNDQGDPKDDSYKSWVKEISFNYGTAQVEGKATLMHTGTYHQPGIRLLRNNRVIEGTTIKKNNPGIIYGTGNKYGKQRLYIELNINGLPVNFMKTGFDDDLSSLYITLKSKLESDLNFLKQAENYRAKKSQKKPGGKGPIPPKPKDIKKIAFSRDLHEEIKKFCPTKVVKLYEELCNLPLKDYPFVSYILAGVFLEALALNLGFEGKSWSGFYNQELNSIAPRNKLKGINQVISNINEMYNLSKHQDTYHAINTEQLIIEFETITPALIQLVRRKS